MEKKCIDTVTRLCHTTHMKTTHLSLRVTRGERAMFETWTKQVCAHYKKRVTRTQAIKLAVHQASLKGVK